MGYYLSALCNKCPDDEISLNFFLDKTFWDFGYKNTKKLLVNGNLGSSIGAYMRKGELIVNGTVESDLGECMKGGRIIVNGTAWVNVGHYMSGGEIHLNGDYTSISRETEGGHIYHNGKRIIKEGIALKSAKIKWL